jgi:hypothetical protein
MSESLNPAQILAPQLDTRAIVFSSSVVSNLLPTYNGTDFAHPIPIPRGLPHRRLYFAVGIDGVFAPNLRSRLVFSLEGQQSMVIPISISYFESGDNLSQVDCVLPAWHVEKTFGDNTAGRQYPGNLGTNQGGMICPDALRFDFSAIASTEGPIFNRYRFTISPLRLAIVADAVEWQIQSITGTLAADSAFVFAPLAVLSSSFPS